MIGQRSSMMVLKENEEKSQRFIEFWEKLGDSVRVYYPQDWVGELKENLGNQKIPYERKQWPCSAPWTHIVIHSKGEFVACCRDFNSEWPFGNLLKGDDIKELREGKNYTESMSIIFITHDIGQAQYISDRVIVMKEGIIVEEGPTDEVFLNPCQPYTQNLLGCCPSIYRKWEFEQR